MEGFVVVKRVSGSGRFRLEGGVGVGPVVAAGWKGGRLELVFPTVAGWSYEVQRQSVWGGGWNRVVEVPGDGGMQAALLDVEAEEAGFVRVLVK